MMFGFCVCLIISLILFYFSSSQFTIHTLVSHCSEFCAQFSVCKWYLLFENFLHFYRVLIIHCHSYTLQGSALGITSAVRSLPSLPLKARMTLSSWGFYKYWVSYNTPLILSHMISTSYIQYNSYICSVKQHKYAKAEHTSLHSKYSSLFRLTLPYFMKYHFSGLELLT